MKNFTDFLANLAARESGGNYGVVNQFGYLGKYQIRKTSVERRCHEGCSMKKIRQIVASTLLGAYGVLAVQSAIAMTQVGERLEMQCGEHKIVLTCGHSDEIAIRQKAHPRLCNNNTVDFIAKDGSKKTFATFNRGKHKDKTPTQLICDELLPLKVFRVYVHAHDTAWSFGVLFAENGTRLNNDEGDSLKLKGHPQYTYRVDYKESKTVGRIQIKESK